STGSGLRMSRKPSMWPNIPSASCLKTFRKPSHRPMCWATTATINLTITGSVHLITESSLKKLKYHEKATRYIRPFLFFFNCKCAERKTRSVIRKIPGNRRRNFDKDCQTNVQHAE